MLQGTINRIFALVRKLLQFIGVYVMILVTARNEVWGKVIFSQACLIQFTGGGLPQCMLGYHPQTRRSPPRSPPPPAAEHAGRYGQRTGGTHPTGMQSCDV